MWVEANILLHTPWLSSGGMDWKIGRSPTPLGYEVMDPSTKSILFALGSIFQFGLPFKHTGAYRHLARHCPGGHLWRASTQARTQRSVRWVTDNGAIGGLGGYGLNLMGGNLTVVALTHIGLEVWARVPLSLLSINANRHGASTTMPS